MEVCQTVNSQQSLAASMLSGAFAGVPDRVVERLPFTIRCVRGGDDLRKAVQVRHAAYARHLPLFAQSLEAPEASDYEAGTVVLLAESKLDGSALGSTRIRNNFHQHLSLEESIVLPEWLQSRRLAEVTRLSVGEGRVGQVVKVALLKACVMYCKQQRIEWAMATGRAPIDRQYERLMFVDVFEDKAPVPLKHVGNIPHRVMAFEIDTIESRWSAVQHPMLDFFCHTEHPDIDIGKHSAAPSGRGRRAADRRQHEARLNWDQLALS